MNKILSKLLNVLKYPLLIGGFLLVFMGIILTYKRLEKDLLESIPVFVPFAIMFVVMLVNIFIKKAKISDNLLLNFTSCVLFAVIIIIGLRAKYDTNMVLYQKYGINYNPQYLSDNLSSIKIMLYCLSGANVLYLLSSLFDKKNDNFVEEPINNEPINEPINSIMEPKDDFDLVVEPITKLNPVKPESNIEEL